MVPESILDNDHLHIHTIYNNDSSHIGVHHGVYSGLL